MTWPAQTSGSRGAARAPAFAPHAPVVLCSKGIEREVDRSLHERGGGPRLPAETPVAVLSGPSFAADVARNLPTAVTLAATDAVLATRPERACSRGRRCGLYHTDDVRGVEIGGAGKNVLAIARGHRRRARARGKRARRPDRPRLRRVDAVRQGFRRAAGDVDGPVRSRRPRAHRLLAAIAQLRLRATPGGAPRRRSPPAAGSPRAPSPRRPWSPWHAGRHRDADRGRGRGHRRRPRPRGGRGRGACWPGRCAARRIRRPPGAGAARAPSRSSDRRPRRPQAAAAARSGPRRRGCGRRSARSAAGRPIR